jgi:hypothetical protein
MTRHSTLGVTPLENRTAPNNICLTVFLKKTSEPGFRRVNDGLNAEGGPREMRDECVPRIGSQLPEEKAFEPAHSCWTMCIPSRMLEQAMATTATQENEHFPVGSNTPALVTGLNVMAASG